MKKCLLSIAVAAFVGNTNGVLLLLFHDGLEFRRGDVLPLVLVADRLDLGFAGRLLRAGHQGFDSWVSM